MHVSPSRSTAACSWTGAEASSRLQSAQLTSSGTWDSSARITRRDECCLIVSTRRARFAACCVCIGPSGPFFYHTRGSRWRSREAWFLAFDDARSLLSSHCVTITCFVDFTHFEFALRCIAPLSANVTTTDSTAVPHNGEVMAECNPCRSTN